MDVKLLYFGVPPRLIAKRWRSCLGTMKTEVKLAYYRREDWKRLLRSIDDKDRMHESWKDWHSEYQKAKKELIQQGLTVHELTIDIEALKLYCLNHGIKNDSDARSRFVAELPLKNNSQD